MPAQLIDLTVVSATFPALEDLALIEREHYLDTIDTIFGAGSRVAVLEGPVGIGKTVLAAQYARRHRHATLSLFIRASNRWGYDPDVLRQDLCNQLHAVLFGLDEGIKVGITDTLLRDLLFAFRTHARRKGERFYFIVDGLDDIPATVATHQKQILDLLPLDYDRCCFLFTNSATTPLPLPKGLQPKSYPLASFNPEETRRFFGTLVENSHELLDIHTICKGRPGELASVRRSFAAGQTPSDFLRNASQALASVFENEWRVVDANREADILLLAILAFDEGTHHTADLVRLLKLPDGEVDALVSRFSFLIKESNEIDFTSEAFRRFAANALAPYRSRVQDLVIDDMLARADNDSATDLLPDKLRQAGRYQELLEFLSPEQLVKALRRGESVAPVRRHVDFGVEAAIKLDRDADLMRFSMQKSALSESFAIDMCLSEIDARVALGDCTQAIGIANSVTLKEDRLRLLAAVAKSMRLRKMRTEPELVEQIAALHAQVDRRLLDEHAPDLASDLLFSLPSLAISLMETSQDGGTPEAAWSFAATSVNASSLTDSHSDSLDSLRAQITNSRLRKFMSAAAMLVGGISSNAILGEIESIPKAHDQIFFLRQWAVQNCRRTDAAQVVEFALALAIRTTEYTPNARDMRQIATPLPYITDPVIAEALVRSFDAQKGSFERYGPTVDFVRLQLTLAESEMTRSYDLARARLLEIYYYIVGEVHEASVRVECLAWLLSTVRRIDELDQLERDEQLRSAAEAELRAHLASLLGETAEQLRILSGAISALAPVRTSLALEVAVALNTEPRRDMALLELVRSAVAVRQSDIPLSLLGTVIDAVSDDRVRDDAVAAIFSRIAEEEDSAGVESAALPPLIARISAMRDPFDQCRAYVQAYKALVRGRPPLQSLGDQTLNQLRQAWNQIEPTWGRVTAGFGIASNFADAHPESARLYLGLAEQDRTEMIRQAPGITSAFFASLGIAISAFTGLLRRRADVDDDLRRVAELIAQIPSDVKQAEIWCDVAERFFANGRADEGRQVVTQRVRPLLDKLRITHIGLYKDLLITATPALYRTSYALFKERIGALGVQERDDAYGAVCWFILRKRALVEPMETPSQYVFDLSYEDIVDLFEILRSVDYDAQIYGVIRAITNCMQAKENRVRFSSNQRNDTAKSIEDIVRTKFPINRYIRHQGYAVALDAEAARLRFAQEAVWNGLVSRARAIANSADRAFVLALLARAMPEKIFGKNKGLLLEAKQSLEQVPAVYDRIERSRTLAQHLWELDEEFARGLCREALAPAPEADSEGLRRVQRDVIDFAHRMDADFAASLVSQYDDDPARVATRRMLKEHVGVLDIRKKMLNASSGGENVKASPAELAKAAWMSLGVLNAKRCEALKPSQLRHAVRVAASVPLDEGYPILAWAIGHVVAKFSETQGHAKLYVRPVFEATLLACQMAARMSARASGASSTSLPAIANRVAASGTLLVRAGERDKAVEYLRNWLEKARDYVKVCDPYFGLDDLELLRLVLAVNPSLRVRVLTSARHQRNEGLEEPYTKAFRAAWRQLSEQDPPETEIVVVGTEGTDKFPIHDRWWLSSGGGLRIGTSFRSLGGGKDSEVSELDSEEARNNEAVVDRYMDRVERAHLGTRLEYELFTL